MIFSRLELAGGDLDERAPERIAELALAQGVRFLEDDPGTPVPIRIAATIAPAAARAGEFVQVQVEVEIGAPWYIYALRPDTGGGPPSRMTLDPGIVEPTGRFSESDPEARDIAQTVYFLGIYVVF